MQSMFKNLTIVTTLALIAGAAGAADTDPRAAMAEEWNLSVDDISETEIPGLYEVALGAQVVYLSADGKFLIEGDLYDIDSRTNLTQKRRSGARKETLATLDDDKRITFPLKDAKHKITVFTDIDCTYCRKLHAEMAELNELGIEVSYLFYPRYGPGTDSWYAADSVWCSDDRHDALTRAKANEFIEPRRCETPVLETYQMGQTFGFRGTPAIITEDGEMIAGYLPPAILAQRLDQLAAANANP